mmetsp:Transcript_20880/g.69076  ORF Transcript_20880/g.69076 Transcript_20880/m.69076 type:complete len:951 (+) Transcript_20880:977-3829(+)
MLSRARELDPTCSMALNHYGNHLFWLWQQSSLTGHAQMGSSSITCSTDPSDLLHSGTCIQLIQNGENKVALETKVRDVVILPGELDTWTVNLATPYRPLAKTDLHKLSIKVKEVPEIDDLASRAYHCTAVPEIQAEAYFILGRNHHVRNEFQGALPFYVQACKLWPHFALAQFRLAQVRAAMNDLPAALEAAEVALELAPNAHEVLRLVGLLRLTQNSTKSPLEVLRHAIAQNSNDTCTWLALASALERHIFTDDAVHERDPSLVRKAIDAYDNAAKLKWESSSTVPFQISNNVGVLHLCLGEARPAQSAFLSALHDFEGCSPNQGPDATLSTVNPYCFMPSVTGSDVGVQGEFWHDYWKLIDGGAWHSSTNLCTLWIDMPIDPPFTVGERIRIGDGGATCIVSVKSMRVSAIGKPISRENALVIQISEPLRMLSSTKPVNLPLYRIDLSCQTLMPNSVPIYLNLAQVHAAAGDLPRARELARLAVALAPNNIRCKLLLARLAFAMRDVEQARKHTASAVKISLGLMDGSSGAIFLGLVADSLSVASVMWRKLENYEEALKTLDYLKDLKISNRGFSTVYANATLSNLHFRDQIRSGRTGIGDIQPDHRAQQLKNAADCARSALNDDPSCAMAAQALGAVLLESGKLDDSMLIFERVQEKLVAGSKASCGDSAIDRDASCSVLDAAINLAHSRLLAGKWLEAAANYATCAKVLIAMSAGKMFVPCSAQTRRADVYHWLARACHGANEAQGARRALAAAIHLQPGNLAFRCHCAILLLESAHGLCRSSSSPQVMSSLRSKGDYTVVLLAIARDMLLWLRNQCLQDSDSRPQPLEFKDLISKCDDVLQKAPTLVAHAREQDETSDRLRHAQRVQLARIVAERHVREAAATAAARATAEECMAKAQRKKEQLDSLQERWTIGSGSISNDGDVAVAGDTQGESVDGTKKGIIES